MIFPHFDIVYLFDQSAGHTKMQENGLNLNQMNVSLGGKVTEMRKTVVKGNGPQPCTVTKGDEQHMLFESPCHMCLANIQSWL
jgi:hypothetical protein